MLDNVKWGEYCYNDLFELVTIKKKLTKNDLCNDGNYPVYSSVVSNNGIMGRTKCEPDFITDPETPMYIVFGDHTRRFSIADESFSVMDNVKVLKPIKKLSYRELLFINAVWQKAIPNKGYSRHWSIAKKVKILLPTKNNKIDYNFMNKYISELEAYHISELEAYLCASGLSNYELDEEEKGVLKSFNNIEWKDIKITELFDIKNTGNILASNIVPESGETPYLCASADNNGVSCYVSYNKKELDKGDCIFIGGKTFVVSYQKKDFYSNDSHNLALYLNNKDNPSEEEQLYLATCVNRSLKHKYTWGDSVSNKKIQKDYIRVPIKDGVVDYKMMGIFISAVKKLIIKDVVEYADKKIRTTKNIVNK